MIRRIAAYLLFGLGLITVSFFRNYVGDLIPYPAIFWLLGLAMFWGGWALLRFTPTIKESQDRERLDKLIAELRENGEKIKVDFSKCDIKTNDYTEEQPQYGSKIDFLTLDLERSIQTWNAISGDDDKNIKQVEVYQSVLVFKNERNGKTETFISRIIPKERATLMFKLSDKKETTLYVDKKNRSRYYFDLEFLNN